MEGAAMSKKELKTYCHAMNVVSGRFRQFLKLCSYYLPVS